MSAQGDEELSLWERVKGFFEKERDTALQNVELEQDSGWHRVKALFDASDGKGTRPEIEHIKTVVYTTSAFAFLLGGRFGKRIIDDHFRRHNHMTVYDSVMHAQRQYHAKVVMGFVKYGCRWGWRAGAFAGVYSFLLVALEAFRNKHDALNYVASGASTGVLYNIFSGWRKMAVGAALGSGLSLPFGIIAQVGFAIIPDEYKHSQPNAKRETVEDNEQDWKQQLNATSSLIQSMEKDLDEEESKDVDR